jgi:phosphate transport system protein
MYHYLEDELDQLRTRVIKMGSLVEEQINFSIRSLFEGNLELAKIVIERDEKVDNFDIKIDKQCQKIFALTQPVAIDLRLIMSALKINNDLERMGDIAVNIAERVEPLIGYIELLNRVKLDEMADNVKIMVRKTIDSFVNNDNAVAIEVIKYDDIIDNYEKQIFEVLVKEMENDDKLINAGALSVSLLRYFERLADHSTNIAEEVVFLLESKIIKHRHNFEE